MKRFIFALTLSTVFAAMAALAPVSAQQGDPKKQLDPEMLKKLQDDFLKKLQDKKDSPPPGPGFDFNQLKKMLDPDQLKKTFDDLTGKGGPLDIEMFKKMVEDLTGKGGPLDVEQLKKMIQDFPPLAAVREAAARTTSANNLRQIGIAFHIHADAYGNKFPAHAIYSKDGKTPLLSWRVAILPYIEENALYSQFKLDEPWHSEHNKKLIARMPKIYEPVVLGISKKAEYEPVAFGPGKKFESAGLTPYQVFTGKDTLFDGPKQPPINRITDGTSNTFLIVEAREPVIWTKPDDLVLPKAGEKMPELGGMFPGGMNVLFCDGSVQWVRRDIDPVTLRAFVTPAGGEVPNFDKLEPGSADEFKTVDKFKKNFEGKAFPLPPKKVEAFNPAAVLLDKKDNLTAKDNGYNLEPSPKLGIADRGVMVQMGKFLGGSYHKVYTVPLKKGDKVVIELKSDAFDSVVVVEDANKKALAINDDDPAGGGTLDSRLEWTAPDDGDYRIIATCLDKKTGEFQLTVKRAK